VIKQVTKLRERHEFSLVENINGEPNNTEMFYTDSVKMGHSGSYSVKVVVFNKWGQQFFETHNPVKARHC